MSVSNVNRFISLLVLTTFVGSCAQDADRQSQSQSSTVVTHDTTPLSTVVSSAPASVTNQTTAEFVFNNPIDGVNFDCQLDDGDTESCRSPHVEKRLQEGKHSFRIFTTIPSTNDSDEQSTNEIEITWRVDFTAPTVRIAGHPFENTSSNLAIFHFDASEKEATFQCQLDGEMSAACTNPWVLEHLEAGAHSIAVSAVDPVGNVGEPVDFQWTIDPATQGAAEIRGIVVVTDGEPIDLWINAEFVDQEGPSRNLAVTNSDGYFVLPEVKTGVEYKLWVDGDYIEISPSYRTQLDHFVHFEIAETSPVDLYGCSSAYAKYACGSFGVHKYSRSISTYSSDAEIDRTPKSEDALLHKNLGLESMSCSIECKTPKQ